jgi:hypothetical protein
MGCFFTPRPIFIKNNNGIKSSYEMVFLVLNPSLCFKHKYKYFSPFFHMAFGIRSSYLTSYLKINLITSRHTPYIISNQRRQ